jgi:hypothetical protein
MFESIGLRPGEFNAWVAENTNKGFEYNLVLAAVAFALAGIGAGNWSVDSALGLSLSGVDWAISALVIGVVAGLGAVYVGRGAEREPHPAR